MTITQFFLSYGSLVQTLTENNREERKTSFRQQKKLQYWDQKE